MENEKYMYLPTLTEDEFVENIESENFFRRSGNPAMIRTKAGVKLYEGARMLARLEETDWIGIVPQGRPTDYVHQVMQYNILDAVHLSDGDKPELVAAKAVWQPEAECRLL